MIVLQSGVPKSGNLWLYKIIQQVYLHAGISPKSFIETQPIFEEAKNWEYFSEQAAIDYLEINPEGYFFRKGSYFQQILDIDHYLQSTNHVWTHSSWNERFNEALPKVDKIIYIIRDPRDVAVSASRFVFTPFMQTQHPVRERDSEEFVNHRLYELVLHWVQHTGGYLLNKEQFDVHFVFYERLLENFEECIQSLSRYLEVELSVQDVKRIKEATEFSSMKAKNPHHLSKGISSQWKTSLTPSQKAQVLRIAGPILEYLNYPISEEQNLLPVMPQTVDHALITQAIKQSRGNLLDKFIYAKAYFSSRRPLKEKIKRGSEFLFGVGRWKI